jgi:hypothetical protein
MSSTHDASGMMNVQPNVTFGRALWFTRMQTHAHTYARSLKIFP